MSSGYLDRVRGTWRVAVVDGSMIPAIEPGDWLLLDPTASSWPRVGSVVVFREPESDLFAIKRIAARGGQHVSIDEGLLHLEPHEAWLLGDAGGASLDSRRYGPVTFDRFVGRAWFRYAPLRRIGLLRGPSRHRS
jgi:type IV secretory pathway protease TraF